MSAAAVANRDGVALGITAGSRLAKRVFDLVVGTVLLAVCAPVIFVLMVAVLGSAGYPVMFRQVRLTKDGRRVRIFKLRTLTRTGRVDPNTEWVLSDDRLTPLGAWLRETHLDELPQLVNVLRGDLSLVGPRPERPYFAAKFAREIPHYDDRLRVPAGLTGWAQVHGLHGDTSITERVRYDNAYVDDWSLALDTVILARTLATGVATVFTRPTGAGRAGSPATSGGRS